MGLYRKLQDSKAAAPQAPQIPVKKGAGAVRVGCTRPQLLPRALNRSSPGQIKRKQILLAIFGYQVFFENVPSSATSLLSSVTSDQETKEMTAGSVMERKAPAPFNDLQPSPSKEKGDGKDVISTR